MIYEHIRATGSYDSVQGVSDSFKNNAYRMTMSKISMYHETKHYYQQVKHLQKGPGRIVLVKIA